VGRDSYESQVGQLPFGSTHSCRISHHVHSGLPGAPPGVEEDRNHTRRLYCLPPGTATCYPRPVNRNIFYIIGVIVVIVIVLKVLHVF
jgi:hypothetical protein